MAITRDIQRLADQIAAQFHPHQIILFGSHAHGTPTPDSDVDLLVVMPCRGSTVQKQLEIWRAVDAPFALDLIVRTPTEIERRLAWKDCFIQEIIAKGRILYESPGAGMGRESGSRLSHVAAGNAGAKRPQPRRRMLSRAAVH
jgi:predicted nucleotidyltransferase